MDRKLLGILLSTLLFGCVAFTVWIQPAVAAPGVHVGADSSVDRGKQTSKTYQFTTDGVIMVNLQSPDNATTTMDNMPNFKFTATHQSQLTFTTSLWLDADTPTNYGNKTVTSGVSSAITPAFPLSNGDYWWWINCTDGSTSSISEKRRITINVFRGDKTFTATYDGDTRNYWLDLPDNFDSSTPTPLVFFLHGYGGSRYSYSQKYPVLRQIFQNHTWIVAAVECRNISGRHTWYNEPTRQDITDILNILRHDYEIDSSHIHIMGNSMGGSGSLKYAMFNSEVIASLVDVHGVTNFTQFYIETPNSEYKASLRAAYGGTPSQVPDVYANESALGNEERFKYTPIMLMHGTLDDVVNASHSRNLNQSLSALGYTVNYIEVPGVGHDAQIIVSGREMEIFNWFNDHPLWSTHTHALHLNAGWNMVSFPVIPSNTTFASIFSGAGYYQVVTWSGTSYVDAENAEAGRGYWVLVLSATTLNITGTRVESYERDLPAGWSMIGSIYECTANVTLIFPSTYQLVTWSGASYISATTIEPGRGYWALVLESSHIIVDQSCNIQGISIVLLNATGPLLTSPSGAFRWLDVADQAYGSNYRNSYNYSQAMVTVAYGIVGSTLTGRLVARNLKPNFAYQLKLVGTPGSSDNALIGFAGRWWQEAWNGSAWTDGLNLNDKGNGSFPNLNDLTYFSRHLVADGSSPTGYHYRYTGYLLFDYFITDSKGTAIVLFETGSSYHVLWKTSQRSHTTDDGPMKTVTFDPDPSQTAYDQDYPISTISIFGEWERLPPDGVNLNPSQYDCQIVLTEESFHETGSFAGNWASTMTGEIMFTIV